MSGPLSQVFVGLTELMTQQREFLETKHFAPFVLCFKIRGQLTVGVLDPKEPTITAKAGVKPPDAVLEKERRYYLHHPLEYVPDEIKDVEENDWLLKLFLERDRTTSIPVWSFIPMREMARGNRDIVRKMSEQRVKFEYDWKRELVEPREVLVGKNFGGPNPTH